MIKEIFGKAKIYRLHKRVDNRGSLEYVFDENTVDFKPLETRIYSMPKEGTFFGIHYREESSPMTKFVTVIKGRGLYYVIDLRKESSTYLQWESIELSEENALAVQIPAGFGHAFISLQDNTIQLYSVDRNGNDAHSKQINYKDPKIGLKLPVSISEISDYDLSAPYVSENSENKSTVILYVHGKGGSADEAEHYKSLFPEMDVFGLNYKTDSPWETNMEIEKCVENLKEKYARIILIANSIGAFYSMNADICKSIDHAFFISPMVDMETLISNMMVWANVSEDDLKREKVIKTDFGEDLSWEYLCYVKENPVKWTVPTDILYGSADHLQSIESIRNFADRTGSSLTVLKDGEHWFHTEDQMKFLDEWIRTARNHGIPNGKEPDKVMRVEV